MSADHIPTPATPQVDPLSLGKEIDRARVALGLGWAEFAARAGVVRSTLNDIRRGRVDNIQSRKKAGIERAAQWADGSIDAILAGGEPTPRPAHDSPPQEPRPRAMSHDRIRNRIRQLRAEAYTDREDDPEYVAALEKLNALIEVLQHGGPADFRRLVIAFGLSYGRAVDEDCSRPAG